MLPMQVLAKEVAGPTDYKKVKVEEVCINGHAFVVVISSTGSGRDRGVAITQVMETPRTYITPQPKKCSE
jgi:hypothetical protein